MNVTERQKSLLLQYMINHPDFGRGRLRYSSGNKKKLDDMWEEVSDILNASGAGPTKQAKEWAKTWRDWKSNTLKKIASFKSYGAGTGGGPPKQLITSKLEEELLDFLLPEASGLENIRQGGFEHLARSEDMSFAPYPTDSNGTKKRKLSPMNTVLVEDVTPSTSNTIDSIDETDNAVYKWLEATNAADTDREMKEIQSEQNPSRTIEVKSKSAGKCARKKDPIDFLEEKKRQDDRLIKLKEEELKLQRENLELKKKIQIMEEAYEKFNENLHSINRSIIDLQEEVRNLGATYIT